MDANGKARQPVGFIGGSNTRWGFDYDLYTRADYLLPYARKVVETRGDKFPTSWTTEKRMQLLMAIEAAEKMRLDMAYVLAYLGHHQRWMATIQSGA
jgi:hypothetical protein